MGNVNVKRYKKHQKIRFMHFDLSSESCRTWFCLKRTNKQGISAPVKVDLSTRLGL